MEDSGLNRSSKEEYENSIAAKLGLDASDIYVDLPPLSVVPGLKVNILKDNDEVVLARNLSRLVSGLYEAQFDHWRGRVYGPSGIEDEVSSEASKVLGL